MPRPNGLAETSIRLSSPAFADGAPIPKRYGYTAANVNPPLEIDDVPSEAASLVLVMEDPDALDPAGNVWDHWVVWNVAPDRREIPEDWTPEAVEEGRNDFGEIGYGGPYPPDGEHTYEFTLFALTTTLDLETGATKDEVEAAIGDSVITAGALTGTYAPE